jgi:tetrapyrrole methylase family protein/MazG family protein
MQKLKQLLLINYPADMTVGVLQEKENQYWVWKQIAISEMDMANLPIKALYIPAGQAGSSLEGFMEIIAHLRAPDGCPWDRKQTHASLRPYMLEETYEALDALDRGDLEDLKEELGDILLQIALHAQIACENGSFTITDVLSGISNKIISRHPHVFGDVNVKDDRDVVKNWEKLKEIERAENGRDQAKGLLDGIPSILPASPRRRSSRTGLQE